jgi:hypothetical protein
VSEGHRYCLFGDGVWCCRAERRAAEELVEITGRVLAKSIRAGW